MKKCFKLKIQSREPYLGAPFYASLRINSGGHISYEMNGRCFKGGLEEMTQTYFPGFEVPSDLWFATHRETQQELTWFQTLEYARSLAQHFYSQPPSTKMAVRTVKVVPTKKGRPRAKPKTKPVAKPPQVKAPALKQLNTVWIPSDSEPTATLDESETAVIDENSNDGVIEEDDDVGTFYPVVTESQAKPDQLSWFENWRGADWTEKNLHQFFMRADRQPDDDPVLTAIHAVKRYGKGARYKFLCEFHMYLQAKRWRAITYQNKSQAQTQGQKRAAKKWVKYGALILNPWYVTFLRAAPFRMEEEKFRHMENAPVAYGSDGIDDLECGITPVPTTKRKKVKPETDWPEMPFPCCHQLPEDEEDEEVEEEAPDTVEEEDKTLPVTDEMDMDVE